MIQDVVRGPAPQPPFTPDTRCYRERGVNMSFIYYFLSVELWRLSLVSKPYLINRMLRKYLNTQLLGF